MGKSKSKRKFCLDYFTKEDYENWINHLNKALNYRNIKENYEFMESIGIRQIILGRSIQTKEKVAKCQTIC